MPNTWQSIIEKSHHENSAAKTWLVTGAVWMVIGTLAGLASAIHLVAPGLLRQHIVAGVRAGPGRCTPTRFCLVLSSSMLIGCALHILPKVLDTKLYSEAMGNLAALFMNAAILIGDAGPDGGPHSGQRIRGLDIPRGCAGGDNVPAAVVERHGDRGSQAGAAALCIGVVFRRCDFVDAHNVFPRATACGTRAQARKRE